MRVRLGNGADLASMPEDRFLCVKSSDMHAMLNILENARNASKGRNASNAQSPSNVPVFVEAGVRSAFLAASTVALCDTADCLRLQTVSRWQEGILAGVRTCGPIAI